MKDAKDAVVRQSKDPFFEEALRALERAAERARALAMQTGTALVVRENGRLCRITFVDGREVIEPLSSQ